MTHKIYCLAIVILMCFTAQSHKVYNEKDCGECIATMHYTDSCKIIKNYDTISTGIWPIRNIYTRRNFKAGDSIKINIQDIYSYLDSLLTIAIKNKHIHPENSDCLQMLYYLGWYHDEYFLHDYTKPHILTADGLRDAYNWVKKNERQLTRTRIYHFLKIWQDMVSEKAIFNEEYFDSLLVELNKLRIVDEPQGSTK